MKTSKRKGLIRKCVSVGMLAGLILATGATGAQAGRPSPSVSFTVCKVSNPSSGLVTELRATVSWSGARANAGTDAVETHAPGSGSSNYNLVNSWTQGTLKSGSHTSVFDMYDPTYNGGAGGYHTPNNVSSSLESGTKSLGGAVTWYWSWTTCPA